MKKESHGKNGRKNHSKLRGVGKCRVLRDFENTLFGWVMFSYRTFTPELFGDHYSSWSRNEISMTSIQINLVITYNYCSHIVLLFVICVHGPMVATPTQTDTTMANVCSAIASTTNEVSFA